MSTKRSLVTLMVCCSAFVAVVGVGRLVQAASVITGEQETLVSPGAVTQIPVEFFLDLTGADDGGALSVGNFQLRVVLSGPNAGTDVSVVDVLDTGAAPHPQAFPLDVGNAVNSTEGFGATVNVGFPFDIDDLDGLMRVVLEVQPNVVGDYTLSVVPGSGNTEITDPIDFTTLLPFDTVDGSLSVTPVTVIPLPAAAWLGLPMLGGLALAGRIKAKVQQ